MKKAVLLLAALAFAPMSGRASSPVESDQGMTALLFSFSGLERLGVSGFDGGIGLRYYVADDWALRPVLQYSLVDVENRLTEPTVKSRSTGVGLNLAVERHFEAAVPSISPYLGLLGGYHRDSGRADISADSHSENEESRWTAAALAGFEWGFTEGLTLGGEYRLALDLVYHEDRTIERGRTRLDSKYRGVTAGVRTYSVFLSIAL